MNNGLTIAFICNGKKGEDHSTLTNYKKFGNKYWDDTQNNQSKIGYYFAFYFQQKYVYIHKVINILQPSQRPIEMNWTSNRQILCLSKQLHKFTWNEWINGIGLGAPYTPNYRNTQTGSWSYFELQNHKKYNTFNFQNFKNTIIDTETENTTSDNSDIDEEAELIAKLEKVRREKREKDFRKNIKELRDNHNAGLDLKLQDIEKKIIMLQEEKFVIENEKSAIIDGQNDDILIKLALQKNDGCC